MQKYSNIKHHIMRINVNEIKPNLSFLGFWQSKSKPEYDDDLVPEDLKALIISVY